MLKAARWSARALLLAVVLSYMGGLRADGPRRLHVPVGVKAIKTLAQNWDDAEAEAFYDLAQGSKLIRFDWFVNLEQPTKEASFLDPEFIRSLGYLPRVAPVGKRDALPVGFVRDGIHLGLTCAACHTGQILYQKTAYLIDGAPTSGDFEGLLRALADSLKATIDNKAKFGRFADRVLGAAAGAADRDSLLAQMRIALDKRQQYNARNLPRDASPKFGPGRVDAFGAILNEVTSTFAGLPDNYAPADAPVSYPCLWDAPQHDFVQWNGAAENQKSLAAKIAFGTEHIGALGRNAGEVMGVFGAVTPVKDHFVIPGRYDSSVNLPNLIDIEESLRRLWSPQWPADFPPVDPVKKAAGEKLFAQHCAECHASIVRDDPGRSIKAWLERSVGTDETMARNFVVRKAKTGVLEGQLIHLPGLRRFGSEASAAEMLKHSVERVILGGGVAGAPFRFSMSAPMEIDLGGQNLYGRFQSIELDRNQFIAGIVTEERRFNDMVFRKAGKSIHIDIKKLAIGKHLPGDPLADLLDRLSPESALSLDGIVIGLKKAAPIRFIYKGRPLNGIWATAPYLHNGSVPNLDELLKKSGKRMDTFRIGSQEFDPDKVGFRTDIGPFEFNAKIAGNLNTGHDYGVEFSVDERAQLIEYMKSL